jgi:hypothetical protein
MTAKPQTKNRPFPAPARESREAVALRENLRKRKEQRDMRAAQPQGTEE